jgi:predicted nucleic acid-binding protein
VTTTSAPGAPTIAATARALGVTLLTHNVKDFALVADLLDVREP